MAGRAEHALDRLLADVIAEEGGTCRPDEIRAELVGVIERVTAELAASGEEMSEFCHWSISGGVGVFTFIGEELAIYVVTCPANRQWELVNRFERMPATDVEAYRARLNARYGKEKPDLVIKPDLAFDWLFGERTPEADDAAPAEVWTGELWTTTLRTDIAHAPAEPPAMAWAGDAAPGDAAPGDAAGELAPDESAAGEPETTAAERTDGAGETDGGQADPTAVREREESLLPLLDAPTLEEMMAAIRAAGGGKGRPIRRSDFD